MGGLWLGTILDANYTLAHYDYYLMGDHMAIVESTFGG